MLRLSRSGRSAARTATVLAGAGVIAGTLALGAPAALAGPSTPAEPPPAEVANAHWLNRACDVPSDRDLDVIKKVYTVAKDRGVGRKVMLATFEAGWVESHMNNLNCGDADSVGVFQQRPSQGWCEKRSQCRDVEHATNAFLDVAIPNNKDHPGYTAGELAQSVQRSAYPDRYDKAKDKAEQLIREARKHTQAAAA